MRILIVDDDAALAHMWRDQLVRLEPTLDAVAVDSADAARKAMREADLPFDIFLIDQRLDGSDVDGVTLMRELLSESADSEAVILTGYDDLETGLSAFEAGAYRYLTKPFDTRELVALLAWLGKYRQIKREGDWHRTLAEFAKDVQRELTVEGVGKMVVEYGPKLGFKRGHLWLLSDDRQEWTGLHQYGYAGLDNFTDLRVPVADLLYPYRALTRGETLFFRGQEYGYGYLEEHFRSHGFRSPVGEWAEILLQAGGRCLGALVLDNDQKPRSLLPEQKGLLRLFGEQAAAALARAQLQEERELEAREWKTISEIGRAVTTRAACGDLNELLDEVHVQIGKLMDASNFIIALVDPDTSLLDFRLHYELMERQPRQWRDSGTGLIGYLIQQGIPLWFPDGTEAAFLERERVSLYGQISQCWLGVPLRMQDGGAIGALVVQHYENPREYDQSHQRLLLAIADQISGAIGLADQREREQVRHRRDEFLGQIRRCLSDVLQESEDWFWHLILKFVTDECGLSFNRAVVFLADGDEAVLRGRLGVGQLHAADARRQWEKVMEERKADHEQQCNLEHFFNHLRTRMPEDRTPIELQATTWTLRIADGLLFRIRQTGEPASIPVDQLSVLPAPYQEGLQGLPTAGCVAAPLIASSRFLGMLLADNAFNGEPVRPETLTQLAELLNDAAILWERGDIRRRELTSKQREQIAQLRDQALQEIQRQDLRAGLQLICEGAREMLKVDSVVIYPLAEDGVTYLTDQIAHAGLLPEKAQKTFTIRPRQHGMNAYVKRVGKVVVPDVAASLLRFWDVPLCEHGFIQDHGIRAFISLALRSRSTGDPLGLIYLNSRNQCHFIPRQEALAAELADIATLAISTARGSEEMTHQHRIQEVNRLRYILEAALSPDADDTKAISALLANTADLLPAANRVELMALRWADGQPVRDEKWRVYRSHRGEPPSETEEAISSHKIAEQVFAKKKLISIPDLQQFGWKGGDCGEGAETRSALAAPVYHNKQVVGVLQVTSAMVDGFREHAEVRITELASAAGLVIGNLRRRQGSLRAMLKAAEEVTRPSSFQEMLQAVVDQACQANPELECVTLWYLRHDTDELVAGPQRGLEYSESREGTTTESGVVRSVMARPKPVWAPNVQNEPILRSGDFIKSERIVSAAVFPLRVEDKSVGALFFNYRQHHQFTHEEQDVLPIFAAIAAAAIQNAQSLQDAQRGKDRLLAALAVVRAAGALWARDQVLRAILTALRDHFGRYVADASPYLLLYNTDEQVLELPEEAREFYPSTTGDADPIRLPLDALRIASKVARRCLDEKRGVVVNIPDVPVETDYVAPDSIIRSELCAGLWRDENLLGALVLKSPQINAFTKEDAQLFELVAEQVAAALDRANQVAEKRVSDYLTGAMAWASDLAHDINVDVGYIRNRAYWLRDASQ